MDAKQSALRTVDCLQRLYALLLALATVEAFKKFVAPHATATPSCTCSPLPAAGRGAGGEGLATTVTAPFDVHWDLLPQLIAVVLTVVPFYHGMHRHLDQAYADPIPRELRGVKQCYFAIDFLLSWFNFALFFALQMSMADLPDFATILFGIFLINALWGFILVGFDKLLKNQHTYGWALLNTIIAGAQAWVVFGWHAPDFAYGWHSAGVALLHLVLDYYWFWELYFPEPDPQPVPAPQLTKISLTAAPAPHQWPSKPRKRNGP